MGEAEPTVVVVGVGNPVCGDDAVGLYVAGEVQRLMKGRPRRGVDVRTSERGGLELLDCLEGAESAIVVDCLALPGARPGRVRELPLDQLRGCARLIGSHDVGLGAALELGRLLGLVMPGRVDVIGIEARPSRRIGGGLSPLVRQAAQRVARELVRRLAVPTPSAPVCSRGERPRSHRRGTPPSPAT